MIEAVLRYRATCDECGEEVTDGQVFHAAARRALEQHTEQAHMCPSVYVANGSTFHCDQFRDHELPHQHTRGAFTSTWIFGEQS